MKKTLIIGVVFVLLCSGCVMQSGTTAPQAAPEGYVKLSLAGTGVNIRPLPQASGAVIAQANTGDVFIAEQWPIENTAEKSQWYRIVSVVKDDGAIVPLSSANKQFKAGFFPFVSTKFVDVSPMTLEEDARVREIPYRKDFKYDLGNNLPDIVRTFGLGKVERKFDLEVIQYFGMGSIVTTNIELPGLEGLLIEGLDVPYDIHGKSFSLSKPGIVYQGIAINSPDFGKEEVRKMMKAKWRNMQPDISMQEDGEHWFYGAEMWHCDFVFDEHGLVKSYKFYYTTG